MVVTVTLNARGEFPETFNADGETTQVPCGGAPLQDRFRVPLSPPMGVI
jgi:hypothetical protein